MSSNYGYYVTVNGKELNDINFYINTLRHIRVFWGVQTAFSAYGKFYISLRAGRRSFVARGRSDVKEVQKPCPLRTE
jgi:hypothetical protein